MKKLILFIVFLLPICLFSQIRFTPDSIPLEEGNVVFRAEFENPNLNKIEIQRRVKHYLEKKFKPYSIIISIDNDENTICRTIDYIEYSSALIYIYSMYMRYNLVFVYHDNSCTVIIRNINFIEKEGYDKMLIEEKNSAHGRKNSPTIYSAKDIMINKTYKTLFIKDASGQITNLALDRINEIVNEIDVLFLRKNI